MRDDARPDHQTEKPIVALCELNVHPHHPIRFGQRRILALADRNAQRGEVEITACRDRGKQFVDARKMPRSRRDAISGGQCIKKPSCCGVGRTYSSLNNER